MRIACFAHSLTTTSPSTTSATRTSPRSSMPMTSRTSSCACSTGMTSRQSSPASQSWVMCLASSSTMLLAMTQLRGGAHEPVERDFESVGGLYEREPHVVGAGGAVEVAGRHEQARFVRETRRDLPAVVGAVGRGAARDRRACRRRRARVRARRAHLAPTRGARDSARAAPRRARRRRARPSPPPASAWAPSGPRACASPRDSARDRGRPRRTRRASRPGSTASTRCAPRARRRGPP